MISKCCTHTPLHFVETTLAPFVFCHPWTEIDISYDLHCSRRAAGEQLQNIQLPYQQTASVPTLMSYYVAVLTYMSYQIAGPWQPIPLALLNLYLSLYDPPTPPTPSYSQCNHPALCLMYNTLQHFLSLKYQPMLSKSLRLALQPKPLSLCTKTKPRPNCRPSQANFSAQT